MGYQKVLIKYSMASVVLDAMYIKQQGNTARLSQQEINNLNAGAKAPPSKRGSRRTIPREEGTGGRRRDRAGRNTAPEKAEAENPKHLHHQHTHEHPDIEKKDFQTK